MSGRLAPRPGWRPLVARSLTLGARWVVRTARTRRAVHARAGLFRLLVPLEPWRYWELARVADEPFDGRCLDVSSPKLLASTLNARGRGHWVAVDLFAAEIERWRSLDPELDLRVADARRLPFDDASFDAIACVSVVEHIDGEGDTEAMAEMWRVLRPGGILHLTTNVAPRDVEVLARERVWGEAMTARPDGRVLFERRYSLQGLRRRLLSDGWEVEAEELARERRPIHRRFFAARPWSFALGTALAAVCPRNFIGLNRDELATMEPTAHVAIYLRLRRPPVA